MSRHLCRILPALLVAALLQCLLLASGYGDSGKGILAAGVCLALIALPLAAHRYLPERSVAMLLVTGALGGLGMLVGAMIDGALGAPPLCCLSGPASPSEWAQAVFSWMNMLMLVTCVAGCWFLCPRCGDRGYELSTDFACAAGMCVGMILGGKLIGDLSAERLGAGGTHLAMLAGMLGGVAAIDGTFRPFAR